MKRKINKQSGLSLIEMLIAVTIAGFLIAGMQGMISTALKAETGTRAKNDSLQQGRFAMRLMVKSVRMTRRLMVPLVPESMRDVLAVTLDPTLDRDKDGWADANNDKDYLDVNNDGIHDAGEPEWVDEDPGSDATNDSAPGIIEIDDDGDGVVDIGLDGVEAGDDADDDGDGDGDGGLNEDWLDPVVYFLDGTTLMQRIPNINPADGTDYQENPIADNVTGFQIKRNSQSGGRAVLVDLTLEITSADGEKVMLSTRVGVGSGL